MKHSVIDINADIGEGMSTDEALLPFISSANIACGVHAGDESTMYHTVAACVAAGIAIGAHPSYPDRVNFGRTNMDLSYDVTAGLVVGQLNSLQQVCIQLGAEMHHVKLHGALYNQCAKDPQLAACITKAVADFNPKLLWYALAGSVAIEEARKAGLSVVQEFFGDRSYQSDGNLTPRNQPNALISNTGEAVKQVLALVQEGVIHSTDGTLLTLEDTSDPISVCVHGDGPHAVEMASTIHQQLLYSGIKIAAP